MTPAVRKMPIGIQDFEDLRTNGYVYVDKTMHLHSLVTMGKPYFLGRPRRFGKSLFLSTLRYYFLGKKELFEGLYISEVEKEWTEYPVIYITFNKSEYQDVNTLQVVLDATLNEYEKQWGITEKYSTLSMRFDTLIKAAYKKSGRKVVVLVDEYDKPLLGTMQDNELNDKIRGELKGFYSVLKADDEYLRFVFLTGVTKFSKVSIFSDLNHLDDISMDKEFAGICGISESELLDNFKPELQLLAGARNISCEAAFAELKKRYDGYHFSKNSEDMYNPFSLLNTFAKNDFADYWFATGTPTFLVKMLKNADFDLPKLDGDIARQANSITDYRADNADPIPVLYQSGYLTIKDYDARFDEYTLGFPNEEVKYGFLNELFPIYLPQALQNGDFSVVKMIKELDKGDIEQVMKMMQAFFATIPYDLEYKKNKNEKYFQSIFYILFSLMGQFIELERKTSHGRIDVVMKNADYIFVFEFKMDAKATAENALKQIDDKDYLIPFQTDNRKLFKIGVEFSQKKGELKRWLIN